MAKRLDSERDAGRLDRMQTSLAHTVQFLEQTSIMALGEKQPPITKELMDDVLELERFAADVCRSVSIGRREEKIGDPFTDPYYDEGLYGRGRVPESQDIDGQDYGVQDDDGVRRFLLKAKAPRTQYIRGMVDSDAVDQGDDDESQRDNEKSGDDCDSDGKKDPPRGHLGVEFADLGELQRDFQRFIGALPAEEVERLAAGTGTSSSSTAHPSHPSPKNRKTDP